MLLQKFDRSVGIFSVLQHGDDDVRGLRIHEFHGCWEWYANGTGIEVPREALKYPNEFKVEGIDCASGQCDDQGDPVTNPKPQRFRDAFSDDDTAGIRGSERTTFDIVEKGACFLFGIRLYPFPDDA